MNYRSGNHSQNIMTSMKCLIEHTATFSSVFLKVKAIPPQIISELTWLRYIRSCKYLHLSRANLVQHVINELNLVRDLSTAEDGKEGTLRMFQCFGEKFEFFLDEEASGSLRQFHSNHT